MPEAELLANDLFDSTKLERSPTDGDESISSLKHLCSEIYARISAFLTDDPPSHFTSQQKELLERVKRQTQTSLGVIREALNRYSFVSFFSTPLFPFTHPTNPTKKQQPNLTNTHI